MREADYDAIAERHRALLAERMGPALERIDWPAERLAAHREQRLREVLGRAVEQSPWHAERLGALDPERFRAADLPALPPMTKADLMESWDAIATRGTPGLARCEAHLESLAGPAYLDDRYHVIASGGSSGRRGVFVYDWEDWADYYIGFARWLARRVLRGTLSPPSAWQGAFLGAQSFAHPTVAASRTFSEGFGDDARMPVTLPLDELVARLNARKPRLLTGYASAVARLASEQEAGRLSIAPEAVLVTSEPLLPEMEARIESAFGVGATDIYGTADAGVVAMGCGEGPGMHLNADAVIVEPVDADGTPVAPGGKAAKILVTALSQSALPLIRYELSDEVRLLDAPCPCGSTLPRISSIAGRLDDHFVYTSGTSVHPHVFRSRLARRREIVEYQVTQTPSGAELRVVAGTDLDAEGLRRDLEGDLARLGLPSPRIAVDRVETIPRAGIGKLKRFVPLEAVGV